MEGIKLRIYAEETYVDYVRRVLQSSRMTEEKLCIYKYDQLEEALEINAGNYDGVLLALDSNVKLETMLLMLHKHQEQKPIFIIRLYTLDHALHFINADGEFDHGLIDTVKKDQIYWVHLETHINDYCNLNCKACNNYAPFCREKVCHSVEVFEQDIKIFCTQYTLGRLFLLGGEPLLEPELAMEFMKTARKYFPDTEIRLLTNGLLIDKMTPEFWDCVKQNHIIFHVTNYIPTAKKEGTIKSILIQNHIPFWISGTVTEFGKRLTLEPLQNAAINSICCGSSACHYLENGKISKCPDAILVKYMDACEGTHFAGKDILEISDIQKDPWEMLEKLRAPIELCKYCTTVKGEFISWEHITGTPRKEDWLVSDRRLEIGREFRKEHHLENAVIIGYGAGEMFQNHYLQLQEELDMRFTADRNPHLWNQELQGGIVCIPPEKLLEIEHAVVMILSGSGVYSIEIAEWLRERSIPYIHIDTYRNFVVSRTQQ